MKEKPTLYTNKRNLGLCFMALSAGVFVYAYTSMDLFGMGVAVAFFSALSVLAGLFAALYYHSREKDFQQALKEALLVCQLEAGQVEEMAVTNKMTPRGKAASYLMISQEGIFVLGHFFRLKDYKVESVTWKSGKHQEKAPGILKIQYMHRSNPIHMPNNVVVTHSEKERRNQLELLIPHAHRQTAMNAADLLRNQHLRVYS